MSVVYANLCLIWLCAAWINKSCSNYRHLQSILCKKLGGKHRDRSSRARDLLQGGNETKLCVGLSTVPPPELFLVFLPSAVGYKEEAHKSSQYRATESSEMNTEKPEEPLPPPGALGPAPLVSSWTPWVQQETPQRVDLTQTFFPQPH